MHEQDQLLRFMHLLVPMGHVCCSGSFIAKNNDEDDDIGDEDCGTETDTTDVYFQILGALKSITKVEIIRNTTDVALNDDH